MPNRDPYIATAIKEEIAATSQKEVDSLNRFLDATIAIIDENNMLYDEYMGQIITAQEQYSDVMDTINKWKENKIRAKKLADNADKAVKSQEVVEKVNTISMSLNPVAAALQFAAKILRTELEHELNGLKDTAAIIDPAIDNFIRFYGGVLRAAPNERVEGELHRKIKDLEDRIAARKEARTARRLKLKQRKKDRADRLDKARKDVKEHNDRIRAQQEQETPQSNENASGNPNAPAQPDATETPGEGEQVLNMDIIENGPTLTPTTEILENADIQTVTAVVESTETGIPQGGLEGADDSLLDLGSDGEAVTVDDIFDAIGDVEGTTNEPGAPGNTEQDYDEWLEDSGLEEDDI